MLALLPVRKVLWICHSLQVEQALQEGPMKQDKGGWQLQAKAAQTHVQQRQWLW
jgi:hypothetical protein